MDQFDPNQNHLQRGVYEFTTQHSQQQLNPQQMYTVQEYEIVDAPSYGIQNPQAQNMISYNPNNYSTQQQSDISSYYEPNVQQIFNDQSIPMQTSPSTTRQYYSYPNQTGGYIYYENEPAETPRTQFGTQQQTYTQRVYGMQQQSGYDAGTAVGQRVQQMRSQPMTQEQLQQSQQRLLGFVVTQPKQQEQQEQRQQLQEQEQQRKMHQLRQQEQDQQREKLQQEQYLQQQQRQRMQLLQELRQQELIMEEKRLQQQQVKMQQPQHVQQQLHLQQQRPLEPKLQLQQQSSYQQFQFQQQQRPQLQLPLQQPYQQQQGYSPTQQLQMQQQTSAGYGTTVPAAATGPYESPSGSSNTSPGTDISDESDELFGSTSPSKRSPSGKPSSKRQGKKRRVQKDPNEPEKPVSAYALFFRDKQGVIKGQNPSASFGDVSKIVASMWDSLDASGKHLYKQKTEVAKKDYLKQLAAYRANLLSKGNQPSEATVSIASNVQFAEPIFPQHQQQIRQPVPAATVTTSAPFPEPTLVNLTPELKPQQLFTATTTATQQTAAPTQQSTALNQLTPQSEPWMTKKPDGMCIRPGCQNPATQCTQWDGEYCTDACVSKNCRDIFTSWVQSKQPQLQHQGGGDIVQS